MIGKVVCIYSLDENTYFNGRYICLLPGVKGFKEKCKEVLLKDKSIKNTYTIIKNVRYV